MKSYASSIYSPIGILTIHATGNGISRVKVNDRSLSNDEENDWSKKGATQLSEYFSGERTEFELEYDFTGFTDFYKSVWKQLMAIPFGKTCSYMDIANALDNSKAVRAVGMANGKNPVGIIIPCHRVIGADGSLTGYAHGLEMKRWLLEFEGAIEPDKQMSLF